MDGSARLLERLGEECPDLLVMDRRVLDSVKEVLAARLARRKAVPAMIATAEAWEFQELAWMGPLRVEAIRQPVRASEFLRTVSRVLASCPREPMPALDAPDVVICGFGDEAERLACELRGAGYRVQTAADGGGATKLVAAGHFRALLLDLQAPGLAEVAGAVGKAPTRRPILAVGRMGWAEAGCLRLLHAVSFLEKPLDLPGLLRSLETALELPVSRRRGGMP
jgi:DNA-binding NtrC family response regulator